jgi:hypothetical protein
LINEEEDITLQKAKKVQNQVDDLTRIMNKNIQDAIERGEKLNELEEKTRKNKIFNNLILIHSLFLDDINEGAKVFTKSAKEVKKQLWWKNIKSVVSISFALLIILIIAVVAIVLSNR